MKSLILFLATAMILLSCKDQYGEKITKDYLEVYFKDGVSREEAEMLIKYLHPLWKEGEKTKTKSVQLARARDTVFFRMVADMEIMKTLEENVFYVMGNNLSESVFKNTPVNVVLTDKYFNPSKTYVYKKLQSIRDMEKAASGNVEVYYDLSAVKAQAEQLALYLDLYFSGENTISFQLAKDSNDQWNCLMVTNRDRAEEIGLDKYHTIASDVARDVFKGEPLLFLLTDEYFEPYHTFELIKAGVSEDQ